MTDPAMKQARELAARKAEERGERPLAGRYRSGDVDRNVALLAFADYLRTPPARQVTEEEWAEKLDAICFSDTHTSFDEDVIATLRHFGFIAPPPRDPRIQSLIDTLPEALRTDEVVQVVDAVAGLGKEAGHG